MYAAYLYATQDIVYTSVIYDMHRSFLHPYSACRGLGMQDYCTVLCIMHLAMKLDQLAYGQTID